MAFSLSSSPRTLPQIGLPVGPSPADSSELPFPWVLPAALGRAPMGHVPCVAHRQPNLQDSGASPAADRACPIVSTAIAALPALQSRPSQQLALCPQAGHARSPRVLPHPPAPGASVASVRGRHPPRPHRLGRAWQKVGSRLRFLLSDRPHGPIVPRRLCTWQPQIPETPPDAGVQAAAMPGCARLCPCLSLRCQ